MRMGGGDLVLFLPSLPWPKPTMLSGTGLPWTGDLQNLHGGEVESLTGEGMNIGSGGSSTGSLTGEEDMNMGSLWFSSSATCSVSLVGGEGI